MNKNKVIPLIGMLIVVVMISGCTEPDNGGIIPDDLPNIDPITGDPIPTYNENSSIGTWTMTAEYGEYTFDNINRVVNSYIDLKGTGLTPNATYEVATYSLSDNIGTWGPSGRQRLHVRQSDENGEIVIRSAISLVFTGGYPQNDVVGKMTFWLNVNAEIRVEETSSTLRYETNRGYIGDELYNLYINNPYNVEYTITSDSYSPMISSAESMRFKVVNGSYILTIDDNDYTIDIEGEDKTFTIGESITGSSISFFDNSGLSGFQIGSILVIVIGSVSAFLINRQIQKRNLDKAGKKGGK